MLQLGLGYLNGKGGEEVMTKAAMWLRRAADLNDTQAMVYLGLCYGTGCGVEQDLDEASIWLQKAAGMHDRLAIMIESFWGGCTNEDGMVSEGDDRR